MIFASTNTITPVLASEDEETDEFLIPPNYRWINTSTISGAQEKIDNGYEVYVNNLDGTSYFRKYRQLNSRDFFVESRFKVDGANNSEIEYFRDVENDLCDFYEDTEGWTAFNGSSLALDENTLEITTITANQGINYSFSANDSYYHLFEFRAKASVSTELNFTFSDVDTHSNATTIGTEWDVYSFTLGNGTFFNVTENSNITIQTTVDGETTFWFDYINLWGQINYFLHYDDEYGSNYIYNGDNEDGSTGTVWGIGADTEHPEWSLWQGLSTSDGIGYVEAGATQVFRVQSDYAPGMSSYNGIKQTQALDYNEESNYTVSTTIRFDEFGGGDSNLQYVATKFIFQDAGGVTLGELRPYITTQSTLWSNTSSTLYFQLDHVIGGADSGYKTFNTSLNDVLEDLPALDTVSERTKIAKIQTIEYKYMEDKATSAESQCWWDNTTLSEESESSAYEDDVWDGVGFKWEILNADFTTGLYIQISNLGDSYSTSNYSLDVVFPDEFGGSFWNYSTIFEHNPKEWLRIDLEFDIDKVDMNLKVQRDDGRSIARLDVYDIEPNPTVLPPLFTTIGFPSLGMDARVEPMEHCYFSVGFIDANWLLNQWSKPDEWEDTTWGIDITQGSSGLVTQAGVYGTRAEVPYSSPYGLVNEYRFWRMDVDRFDGITFDVQIAPTCPEAATPSEWGNMRGTEWTFGIYNVQPDGSLLRIFMLVGGTPSSDYYFALRGYNSGGSETLTYEPEDCDQNGGSITKISFFHEDSTKVTLQARTEIFEIGGDPINEEHSMSQDGLTLTKEYVFYMAYHIDVQVSSDQETTNIDFKMAGMDVTRKDILGQIVGMVLGPLIGFVALLLSPLIFFFQILIFVFRQLIGGLASVFETVVGGLLVFLDPLFAWLSDILEGLVGIGAAFLQSIIDGLGDLLEDFIDALALLFDVLWAFLADAIFFLWDDFLGLEDFDLLALVGAILEIAFDLIILFIELLLQVPPFIVWAIETWFFYGWLIFAFMWALIILFPAMSGKTKSASDWIDEMLHRMMWNISPGSITILGVTVLPSKIPLIIFLLPATVFTLTGTMLW